MKLKITALALAFATLAAPAFAQLRAPGLPEFNGPEEDAPIEYLTPSPLGIDGKPVPKMDDVPLIYAVCMLGIESKGTLYYSMPFKIMDSDKGPSGFLPVEKLFWDYVAKTYKEDVSNPGIYGCDSYFSIDDVGDLEETIRSMFMEYRYPIDVETTFTPTDQPGRLAEGYDPNNKPVREERIELNDAEK